MTIVGKNFGARDTTRRSVAVGETACDKVQWFSDTQIACLGLKRGTGSFHNVRVNIEGDFKGGAPLGGRVNPSGGLTSVFSYDRPRIDSILPNNGPTVGYVTAMTIFGRNFGMGPYVQPDKCVGDSSGLKYLLKPLDPAYCFPAFVQPQVRNFPNMQSEYILYTVQSQVHNFCRPFPLSLEAWRTLPPSIKRICLI